jgi:hypothetical protein
MSFHVYSSATRFKTCLFMYTVPRQGLKHVFSYTVPRHFFFMPKKAEAIGLSKLCRTGRCTPSLLGSVAQARYDLEGNKAVQQKSKRL